MAVDVELVADARAELGEGPVWDERDAVLWWVDIPGKVLHRFDPETGDDSTAAEGLEIGCLAPRASGGLVLALPDRFVSFDPARGSHDVLASVDVGEGVRMNDGKCDPRGRFWAGSMAYDFTDGAGAFYRLDADHRVHRVLDSVTCSNGLAWSADELLLYYIDTGTGGIDVFDVDPDAATLSNRRRLVDIAPDDGAPDGMTIDSDGHLWVSLFNGGAVRRYTPKGDLDAVVELPVRQVTCCAFGGDDLADLYITTASYGFTPEDREEQPAAGGLFRCRPGVTGTPVNAYAG